MEAILQSNWQRVCDAVAKAAQSSGRTAADVTIVGVTKYVDDAITRKLIHAGCKVLGEARPQQLWSKAQSLSDLPVQWHLIGHLQRNKVRRTLPITSLIHSVDSVRLLEAIAEEASQQQRVARVLIEANVSGDATKTGLAPDALPPLIEASMQWPSVKVDGLMTMAGLDAERQTVHHQFASLRGLRDQLQSQFGGSVQLTELSMGMSGDFEIAIAEGATIVRIGSTLFDGIALST
jgi:PLP dependent protein